METGPRRRITSGKALRGGVIDLIELSMAGTTPLDDRLIR
jgi:hypothetical protein